VQKSIDEEKEKKLSRYSEEKSGKAKGSNKETCDYLLREVSLYNRTVDSHKDH